MKTKNILTVLAVLVATFIYPDVTTWLVPFVISILILGKFRKIDIAKFIGFLSLKPVFITSFLWLLAARSDLSKRLYSLYSFEIGAAIMVLIPELILTIVVVYGFRHLLGDDKLVWMFLIGDIIRWLIIVIELLIPDPFPEPYFYSQLYVSIFFLLTFPSLYAIIGYISVRKRVLNESVIH